MLRNQGHVQNITGYPALDSKKPVVRTFVNKRRPFYKLGYNPNHIPHQGNWPKIKAAKPKLDAWENPKHDWPPRLPRATMHKGRTLLNHIESDMRKKIIEEREF